MNNTKDIIGKRATVIKTGEHRYKNLNFIILNSLYLKSGIVTALCSCGCKSVHISFNNGLEQHLIPPDCLSFKTPKGNTY